jgi:hypothetical protein
LVRCAWKRLNKRAMWEFRRNFQVKRHNFVSALHMRVSRSIFLFFCAPSAHAWRGVFHSQGWRLPCLLKNQGNGTGGQPISWVLHFFFVVCLPLLGLKGWLPLFSLSNAVPRRCLKPEANSFSLLSF